MRELFDKRKHFRSEPHNDIHKTNATSAHARRLSRANNAMNIRESVDSLCRDGADTDTPIYQMKRLITPERYSYKPFQTYNKAL